MLSSYDYIGTQASLAKHINNFCFSFLPSLFAFELVFQRLGFIMTCACCGLKVGFVSVVLVERVCIVVLLLLLYVCVKEKGVKIVLT